MPRSARVSGLFSLQTRTVTWAEDCTELRRLHLVLENTHLSPFRNVEISITMKNLSSTQSTGENFTLLAVSADLADHRLFGEIIEPSGFRLRTARSCAEGLRLLREETPTVIACERDLPDGTWKDLFSWTRKQVEAPPVVVISRHAYERLWAEVLNIGGYDVLAKPLEALEVSRVLSMACRHGRTILQTA
jgi:CheY-like chemotaxis protein